MTGIKVVDPSWRASGPGEAQHTGTATWPSAGHSGQDAPRARIRRVSLRLVPMKPQSRAGSVASVS